jgi:DNA-binding protein YbaB
MTSDEICKLIEVNELTLHGDIEHFAALVASAEREACAAMAEAFHRHQYDFTGDIELHEAIRARGETNEQT